MPGWAHQALEGRPERLAPLYDSGDAAHPNDAGYEAMANAVDLDLFR